MSDKLTRVSSFNTPSVMDLIHRIGQFSDDRFRKNVKLSLTPRQFTILRFVGQNAGTNQTRIVEATGIDRSTMADIIRRLVLARFLTRRRTRADARNYAVSLTPEGRSALEQAEPVVETINAEILASIPADERSDFMSKLSKIVTRSE